MPSQRDGGQVIGIDFTDLRPDGNPDPLGAAVMEVALAAARVSQSPGDLVGAQAALGALRDRVRVGVPGVAGGLPLLADYIEAQLQLLAKTVERLGDENG